MFDVLLLVVAGFASGVLNAVAGGGTFLTFPALVFLGVPPVMANATATLTALPGYISSAWAFRHNQGNEGTLGAKALYAVAIGGSLLGALLLMLTTDAAFSGIVPWLLLAATALFAVGPIMIKAMRARGISAAGPLVSAVAFAAVSIYGGYFNGGLGIMLLATLGLLGYSDLHAMNGLKNLLSALLSLTSTIAFVLAGLIAWKLALPMAIAATLGGYAGAHYSRKIKNTAYLRGFVVLVGGVMTVLFFLR